MSDIENGLKCSWHGKEVKDMSRDELIAFIGQLDSWASHLQTELLTWKGCALEYMYRFNDLSVERVNEKAGV